LNESGITGSEDDVCGKAAGVRYARRGQAWPLPVGKRRRKDIVTRTRFGIALLALLVAATTVLAAAPSRASATALKEQIRIARIELRHAQAQLADAEDALAAATRAHQKRGLGTLVLAVAKGKRAVRFWKGALADVLAKQAKLAAAQQAVDSGDWKTLCRRAAKKYGVNADGLYRLMMMESGGKPRAVGAGRYYGLFQYALVTWKDDWNPWRGRSVYDGAAQIEASAYAIKKGMGHSLWGNTYPAAF
jgi:hypothetical protein